MCIIQIPYKKEAEVDITINITIHVTNNYLTKVNRILCVSIRPVPLPSPHWFVLLLLFSQQGLPGKDGLDGLPGNDGVPVSLTTTHTPDHKQLKKQNPTLHYC